MAIVYNIVRTRPSTDAAWIADEDSDFITNFQAKIDEYISSGHITSLTHSYPNDLEHHATLTVADEASDAEMLNDPSWMNFIDTIYSNYQSKGITTVQSKTVE